MKIFKENKLTNLNFVFEKCNSLKELDLSYFETKYIAELKRTFYECGNLTKINLTHFDVSKVITTEYMFYYCRSLAYLDLSYFNLENLKKSNSMFYGCDKLKEIIFNDNTITKNLEDMESMFTFCGSLEYINTKIFKENKLKSFRRM